MNNGKINKNNVKKQNKVVVLKRKKKKKMRRVVFSFLFISVILIVLLFTLNIFKIDNVEFSENENVNITELVSKANAELVGKNIFFVNCDKILNEVRNNPYVENVTVKKKFPNKISIIIDEKKALFYVNNGKYVILDEEGTVLEIDNKAKNGIIEITGIDVKEDIMLKESIDLDKLHKDLIQEFADLFSRNTSGLNPYKLDVGNLSNLSLFVNNIEIKMGDLYHIKDKLNSAFTIINDFQFVDSIGYIDVSNYKVPVYNFQ